ncbi:MAG: RNA polymerase sigma factor [Oscillospiraceae bacterium]
MYATKRGKIATTYMTGLEEDLGYGSCRVCNQRIRGDTIKMSMDFADCVKKAQQGDADAFAELYSLVYKDLYRIALLNLNNEHDASDVVSDAVLEAYTSIQKLKNVNAFKSWMIAILTVKIKNKQKEYIKNRDHSTELDEAAETESAVEPNFEGIEVMEGFNRLSEEERLMLSLDVVSGYKSEEIAGMCGSNANTVRSRVSRAKEKLKQFLSDK